MSRLEGKAPECRCKGAETRHLMFSVARGAFRQCSTTFPPPATSQSSSESPAWGLGVVGAACRKCCL
eukprot:1340488-Lingulodinium_polyedra.AAC.1